MNRSKSRKITVIFASTLCFWNIKIASVNAVVLTFTNQTDQIATGFHMNLLFNHHSLYKKSIYFDNKSSSILNDANMTVLNAPIPPGGIFTYNLDEHNYQLFGNAQWSFAEGSNKPVLPNKTESVSVPESTTILGTATVLSFLAFFKQQKAKKRCFLVQK